MIHVFIKPVRRTHYKFEDVLDFELQNIAEAKRLIIQSLLKNPLNNRLVKKDSELRITVKVTIGGEDYYLFSPWASIGIEPFLNDCSEPVVLDFHLVKYVGDNATYLECPRAEYFLSRDINWSVFISNFYHEFGHLLDALNPKFGYNTNAKNSLTKEQNHNFLNLWNAYIDRRLRDALGNNYFVESIKDLAEIIWSVSSEFTFLQLVQMSRKCVDEY